MNGRKFFECKPLVFGVRICLEGCNRLRITAMGDDWFRLKVKFVPHDLEEKDQAIEYSASLYIDSWEDAEGAPVVLADLPCYARYAEITWEGAAALVQGEAIAIP